MSNVFGLLKKGRLLANLLVVFWVFLLCLCFCSNASADVPAGVRGLGKIAWYFMESYKSVGMLILAFCYISGFGFVISALFKFKQHRENPTQIPVTTPISLLAVGVLSMVIPGLMAPLGRAVFGNLSSAEYLEKRAGGFMGGGAKGMNLPGLRR